MKFAIICTVLALAYSANTLSVGGYGFKGPIFGSASSKPQPQAKLEAVVTEVASVEENFLTTVDSKSVTEVKNGDPVSFVDPVFAHKPIYDFPATHQLEVEAEADNYTTDMELKSEIQAEPEEPVILIDAELVHQPTNSEPLTELEKPDILVKPSFLDKFPNPSIIDPY